MKLIRSKITTMAAVTDRSQYPGLPDGGHFLLLCQWSSHKYYALMAPPNTPSWVRWRPGDDYRELAHFSTSDCPGRFIAGSWLLSTNDHGELTWLHLGRRQWRSPRYQFTFSAHPHRQVTTYLPDDEHFQCPAAHFHLYTQEENPMWTVNQEGPPHLRWITTGRTPPGPWGDRPVVFWAVSI